MSRGQCQTFLTQWIMKYVTDDDQASAATKSKFPLREARIEVSEIPGKPGSYHAVAWMRPWLQMEELTASMRMVARIPKLG